MKRIPHETHQIRDRIEGLLRQIDRPAELIMIEDVCRLIVSRTDPGDLEAIATAIAATLRAVGLRPKSDLN